MEVIFNVFKDSDYEIYACYDKMSCLKQELETADAVVIGAGAGLSTSAGFSYTGERFQKYFGDFTSKYGFRDMYSGGFYPFDRLPAGSAR